MLHGRSAEQERIDALLAAARAGRSGALVVWGEAGVGKTALLDYAAGAAGGMRVLRGTGIESEAELPFSALRLLLRPALGRLNDLPGPQAAALRGAFGLPAAPGADRFLIGLAALSALAELAGDGALLCLIDDAQWLDRASADALLFAARRLDAEGIVLLFATREDPLAVPGLAELHVGGLDPGAARALLAEQAPDLPADVAERVLAEAAGNPLALRELPGAALGRPATAPMPLPRRIQQAYDRRVAGLPAPTRTFLLVAAAEGTGDLGPVLRAATSLGITAEAADIAERSGLITVHQQQVVFRHPLLRAAVYQGATFAERSRAHSALAGVLTGAPDADRRAWHRAATATGPDESIAAELENAADRARQRLGHAAASAALERAARLTPHDAQRARRLVAAAVAALDAGQPEVAVALASQVTALTSEPAALAEIARVRAWEAMELGAVRQAHRLVVDGADAVADADPRAASALLMIAVIAGWWSGDAKLVQDVADRMTRMALPSPAGPALEQRSVQAMASLLAGDPEQAVPLLREVLAAARRVQPEPLDVSVYVTYVALLVGDFDAARELMLATVEACRARGMIRFLAPIQQGLSFASFCLNRFRAASASATEGLRLAQDTGQPVRIAGLRGVLALLAAVAGEEERCRELARLALDNAFAEENANVSMMVEWALALLDLGLGRTDAALERFELAASGALRNFIHPVFYAPDHVEAAVRRGEPDRAAEPLARFAAWAQATSQPWALAVLHRCRALAGSCADAEDHYRAALALHAGSGRPFEHARTALLYGEWLRRGRRNADARIQLRAALTLFDRAGTGPWADRARAELRAAGETAVSGAPGPDALSLLTPQELQVVRLAASGATNRDIAARLFLSPRTVSHHLYRAFPKLGVSTRTALARLDLDLPEDDPA
jgi:DNA-binding CsgD family transcriptional regulator